MRYFAALSRYISKRLHSRSYHETPPMEARQTVKSNTSRPRQKFECQTFTGGIVYTSYDTIEDLPPTSPSHTRFVCISDTHSHTFDVPNGDVLIHSGDLSKMGRQSHLIPTAEWLRSLPHNHKIVIAGNHDLTLDNCEPGKWYDNNGLYFHRGIPEDTEACRRLFTGEEAVASNLHYLEYDSITIQLKEGGRVWKIYGSPGTPWFGGWAFNYGRGGEDAEVLSGMPDDCDIVVTHGPPCGILDLTISGVLAGCQVLRDRLSQIRPALSVFGHIHESRGVELPQWKSDEDSHTPKRSETLFVNAANMPMGAKARELRARGINTTVGGPGFQPIVVDLEDTA